MTAPLHPSPAVDALWRLGLDARSPLLCSAGRTGFYIDATGDYWKCGAVSSALPPIGNVLRDGELRAAPTAVCDRFPTAQANPGAEIQCWCVCNRVLDVTRATPADLQGLYDNAFVHLDVSRLCNFSCHYCTVPREIFDARQLAKKREHLSPWARKPYLDRADLTLIGREIFAKCRNVTLRIAGLMEPLMNPDILALFEVCRAHRDRLAEIRLMSNLGIERTFDDILEMGFGSKLNTVVSMHVVDDNFDPFRVVRQMRQAQAAGTRISSHIVPSPLVLEVMRDYLDFFSLHGVHVRPAPYIVDDPAGNPLEKGTQRAGQVPRHYPALKAFLGERLADGGPASRAAYLREIRELNRDAYAVLDESRGAEAAPGGRRTLYLLKADSAAA
ncbi:radical SAM protein [Rubrivivax gelatinosus]|uniref:radical SAM protein n=1 Tax=Rubrivivax gelatinosus TaxID=28068 RepID=UPI000318C9EC|nr:radical SAM protein [Rubrivivax gelatinosus]MBG6081633.1 hypothetical protein [Rubrivivax gelatinosus]